MHTDTKIFILRHLDLLNYNDANRANQTAIGLLIRWIGVRSRGCGVFIPRRPSPFQFSVSLDSHQAPLVVGASSYVSSSAPQPQSFVGAAMLSGMSVLTSVTTTQYFIVSFQRQLLDAVLLGRPLELSVTLLYKDARGELFSYLCVCSFVCSFVCFFVSSFLRFFVSSFLRFFVSSFLRFFVSSFLRFFVSSFLRFFVSSFLRFFFF